MDSLPLLLQAYEVVQGALVRWSEQQTGTRPPPTAVMVHGILGSRKNMQAYARRLVEVANPDNLQSPKRICP